MKKITRPQLGRKLRKHLGEIKATVVDLLQS